MLQNEGHLEINNSAKGRGFPQGMLPVVCNCKRETKRSKKETTERYFLRLTLMVQSRHWIEIMLLMRLKLFEILVQATVIYGRSPAGETHGFGVFKNIVTHIKALVLQCFEYSGIHVVPLDRALPLAISCHTLD